VQRQQRKSDVMTSFGFAACSAVYYHASSSLHYPPCEVPIAYRTMILQLVSIPGRGNQYITF
jgi:hypothetical protein